MKLKNKQEGLEGVQAKKKKPDTLRVLVFEPEGGSPYLVDVVPNKSTFDLPGQNLSYRITRGSVWIEDGLPRVAVNAENPQTINLHNITGNSALHPSVYNADINNNLAEQVANIARTQPFWQRGATWGLLIGGIVLGLLFLWLNLTVGNGFENIQDALNGLEFPQGESQSRNPTPAEEAGHNNISPGGR